MSFWSALVSSDDVRADSVVVGMLLCLVALCILTGYDVMREHHAFDAIAFATAAGEIIGAGAGVKTLRDRFAPAGNNADKSATQGGS